MNENQSTEIGKLVLALSKAQGKFEGAAKSSDNPFFKSKYADLHECIEAAKGPLAENELAVVQTTDTDERGIWVITTLGHSSGEWIRGRLLMKPKKDDDQGTGSSITYGRRYTFAAIVGLAQKDDDGNESVKGPSEEKKGKANPTQAPPPNQPPHGNVIDTAAIIDQWEKAADNNAATVETLGGWYKTQKSKIDALPADVKKSVNNYVAQLKATIVEKSPPDPEMIRCPEAGDREQVKSDCEGSACQKDCPVWKTEAA